MSSKNRLYIGNLPVKYFFHFPPFVPFLSFFCTCPALALPTPHNNNDFFSLVYVARRTQTQELEEQFARHGKVKGKAFTKGTQMRFQLVFPIFVVLRCLVSPVSLGFACALQM